MHPSPKIVAGLIAATALLAVALPGCGSAGRDAPATAGAAGFGDSSNGSLIAAFEAAGLTSLASALGEVDVAELTDAESFTFFSPDDTAFTELSADELADLLADRDGLVAVLRNHVVPQRLDREDLTTLESVTTEAGNALEVVVDGADLTVGGAVVIDGDRLAGSSLVHVVDSLLLPA